MFESHQGHGYLSVVSVVFCQVEVSATKLITRPEESYRLWCVVVYDLETSRIGAPYIYDTSNLRVKFNAHTRSQNFKLPNCFVITELKTMFRTKCVGMSIVYLHIKRHNLDVIKKYHIIRLDGAFIFLNYTQFKSQIEKTDICISS